MIQHFALEFFLLTRMMERQNVFSSHLETFRRQGWDIKQFQTNQRECIEALAHAIVTCEEMSLEFSAKYAKEKLKALAQDFSYEKAKITFEELTSRIQHEMSKHLFMQIPLEKIDYYEKPKLFGKNVYRNFKTSRVDVREAGNCYAAGRNTACVFHCMRVLEKGLHALVHELNNTFSANITFNKQVEFINWGTIIDKVEAEIKELLKPTRQPRLAPKDLQFYSEAAKEFVYFKNAWRDDVSHSRSAYDENEAKAIIEHVCAFMQHIATRLKE
jgi:hypothetical protein